MVKEKLDCLADGCEKKAVCKGYCMAHYTRLKDYGRLNRVLGSNQGLTCKEEECDRAAVSSGYCKTHYQKRVTYGPDKARSKNRGHPLYAIWYERKIRNVLVEEWMDFKKFVADVGALPSKFHALVRLRKGNYGPDNFEWRPHLKREKGEPLKTWHARKWQARKQARPGWDNERRLKRNYGLTLADYDDMLKKQNGVCAICLGIERSFSHRTGQLKKLAIDHSHTTGKVRGLLCSRCNLTIGHIEESIELLRAMELYMQRHLNGRLL